MKFLVIGLGSMGTRRIRCLQHLKYFDIHGYDIDPKKTLNAKKKSVKFILENIMSGSICQIGIRGKILKIFMLVVKRQMDARS